MVDEFRGLCEKVYVSKEEGHSLVERGKEWVVGQKFVTVAHMERVLDEAQKVMDVAIERVRVTGENADREIDKLSGFRLEIQQSIRNLESANTSQSQKMEQFACYEDLKHLYQKVVPSLKLMQS